MWAFALVLTLLVWTWAATTPPNPHLISPYIPDFSPVLRLGIALIVTILAWLLYFFWV